MEELREQLDKIGDAVQKAIEAVLFVNEQIIRKIVEQVSDYIYKSTWAQQKLILEIIDSCSASALSGQGDLTRSLTGLLSFISSQTQRILAELRRVIGETSQLTSALLEGVRKQFEQIDRRLEENFQQRVERVYGRIGEFSAAIGAPPDYLENVIRNARIFALFVSCMVGLDYARFSLEWNKGLNNLLAFINRNRNYYSKNPQRIKADVENALIRPAFEIARSRTLAISEQFESLEKSKEQLLSALAELESQVGELGREQKRITEQVIEPGFREIRDDFERWKKIFYYPHRREIYHRLSRLNMSFFSLHEKIWKINTDMQHPGTLLGMVDWLDPDERRKEEALIGEVSSRRLREQAKSFYSEIRRRIS